MVRKCYYESEPCLESRKSPWATEPNKATGLTTTQDVHSISKSNAERFDYFLQKHLRTLHVESAPGGGGNNRDVPPVPLFVPPKVLNRKLRPFFEDLPTKIAQLKSMREAFQKSQQASGEASPAAAAPRKLPPVVTVKTIVTLSPEEDSDHRKGRRIVFPIRPVDKAEEHQRTAHGLDVSHCAPKDNSYYSIKMHKARTVDTKRYHPLIDRKDDVEQFSRKKQVQPLGERTRSVLAYCGVGTAPGFERHYVRGADGSLSPAPNQDCLAPHPLTSPRSLSNPAGLGSDGVSTSMMKKKKLSASIRKTLDRAIDRQNTRSVLSMAESEKILSGVKPRLIA
eukprot:PhF_6_TR37172/c0_g1_i2/m.54752